ncbi:thiamine pyrophosphokinase [Microthyrium microscopicum]|uniref:Thiamine pyrophosphokinase n=1 Tax=Microthyrium microscopicum TaxID=703497 RepID=A0A6A6TTQ4_9PEZI|nr:thiamine pyrophosphokinase [Microthyrium microscopicum]
MEYNPAPLLLPNRAYADTNPSALILLNRSLHPLPLFKRLWTNAKFHVVADGAANWLYDEIPTEEREEFLPTLITGDLDSITPSVRSYYESQHIPIIANGDQYSTDFAKAVKQARSLLRGDSVARSAAFHAPPESRTIVVHGSLGGRVDQGVGVLHELLRETRVDKSMGVWLVTERCLCWWVGPGRSRIGGLMAMGEKEEEEDMELKEDGQESKRKEDAMEDEGDGGKEERIFKRHCGILPILGKAVISTTGLEWDVTDWETEMGGKVSTSNHVVSDEVTITTDQWVLFSIEIGKGGGVNGEYAQKQEE